MIQVKIAPNMNLNDASGWNDFDCRAIATLPIIDDEEPGLSFTLHNAASSTNKDFVIPNYTEPAVLHTPSAIVDDVHHILAAYKGKPCRSGCGLGK